MNILIVLCHPRRNSFTGAIADAFAQGAREAGHEIELADLYSEDFDPRLEPDDEPDWSDATKTYSQQVRDEMQRVDRNDAIVLVFPVWWWSMPAMLKGWIDRVWNKDWAYGSKKLKHEYALAIGVAAGSEESFSKRSYDASFTTQIKTGIFEFCGIDNARAEILHGSFESEDNRKALLARARELGEGFPH